MDETKSNINWVGFGLIVLFILLLVGLVSYLYVNSQNNKSSSNKNQTNSKEEVKVSIEKDSFSPATVEIKKGTTVTWVNNDTATHQIASDPHPLHNQLKDLGDGEVLNQGEGFSFTFDKTGTFTYHDHLNPLKYKGTVVVK